MGAMLILAWKTSGAATSATFRIQYQLKGSDEWIDDAAADGAAMDAEWDGTYYHIISDASFPCGVKLRTRVATILEDGTMSDFATSKMRKIKATDGCAPDSYSSS